MALRDITGDDGRRWRVWETRPVFGAERLDDRVRAQGRGTVNSRDGVDLGLFSAKRQSGWLTFATDGEKRRLSPIPEHWDALSEPEIRALLSGADRVPYIGDATNDADRGPGKP